MASTHSINLGSLDLQAAAISFGVSFLLSSALTGNPTVALISASMAGICSLVSSATLPLFRKLWNSYSENLPQYIIRTAIVIGAVGLALNKMVNWHIQIIKTIAFTCLFQLAIHGASGTRTLSGPQYFFVG